MNLPNLPLSGIDPARAACAAGVVALGVTVVTLALWVRRLRSGRPAHRDDADGAHRLMRVAVPVLSLVALTSAALSYAGVVAAVPASFGVLRWAAPVALDAAILGFSLVFIVRVRQGRPGAGWRLWAHGAVAGTVYLNLLSSPTVGDAPWHLVGPIMWSLLVELTARDVLGEMRASRKVLADRIPARLWVTAPAESARASWRMARTGVTDAATARDETERCAAARDLVRAVLPAGRARREILRRLWSGALAPAVLIDIVSRAVAPGAPAETAQVEAIHRDAMRAVAGIATAAAVTPGPADAPDEPAPVATTPGMSLHLLRSPIPDAVEDVDPVAVEIAREGHVPGVKAIKTRAGCGDGRAYRIQEQAKHLIGAREEAAQ